MQGIVRAIMATHYNAAKPHKGINGADPFVIAMAKDGGANWVVVVTFQQMILAEGWRF